MQLFGAVTNLLAAVLCTVAPGYTVHGLYLAYIADFERHQLHLPRRRYRRDNWRDYLDRFGAHNAAHLGAKAMTKNETLVLVLVVAGVVTNFLGAAFTILRLRELLKSQSAGNSRRELPSADFSHY